MRFVLSILMVLGGCATPPDEEDDLRPRAREMIAEANRWKPNDPVPSHLLELREPLPDECLGLPTDTASILQDVTNYGLLLHLVPLVSGRLLDFVVERAVLVGGPTRFFHDLMDFYLANHKRLNQPEHARLFLRLSEPHVHVVGLFIRHKDMTDSERKAVLDAIEQDLRRGESWDAVYDRHFRRHEYVETEGLNKGSTLTKIGNYGDFVISPNRRSGRPFRSTSVAEDHVAALLEAKKGDVLILDDEDEEQTLLYKVLESYTPPK